MFCLYKNGVNITSARTFVWHCLCNVLMLALLLALMLALLFTDTKARDCLDSQRNNSLQFFFGASGETHKYFRDPA